MTAFGAECRSANENQYQTLLADFDAAYRHLKELSEDFNNAVAGVSAGQCQHEGRSRIDYAGRAYEDAREEFMFAVRKLNAFLIGQIVSSRSSIQVAANHG
jgi:hypothetical protein